MNITLTIPDCGGCCSCRGRAGDTLEAVIVDIVMCTPYSIVSGVNGVFNDVDWQAGTQDWRKVVGVITDGVDEFDATLVVSCAGGDGCEVWVVDIIAIIATISTKIYSATYFGEGCPAPSEFGDPVPNDNTACGVIPAFIGAEGSVALSVP